MRIKRKFILFFVCFMAFIFIFRMQFVTLNANSESSKNVFEYNDISTKYNDNSIESNGNSNKFNDLNLSKYSENSTEYDNNSTEYKDKSIEYSDNFNKYKDKSIEYKEKYTEYNDYSTEYNDYSTEYNDNPIEYDEYSCGCPRNGPKLSKHSKYNEVFCSEWASSRGGGQRVVSYLIYGDSSDSATRKMYHEAIEDRVKEVTDMYPGWIFRLYHNSSKQDAATQNMLCSLYCKYSIFDPCQIENLYTPELWKTSLQLRYNDEEKYKELSSNFHYIKDRLDTMNSDDMLKNSLNDILEQINSQMKDIETKYSSLNSIINEDDVSKSLALKKEDKFSDFLNARLWRFLPMGDPLVSEFLIRDLDAYILRREVAAVSEWVNNSTAVFHVMRDHPSHFGYILAGLWGGSRQRNSEIMTQLLQELMQEPKNTVYNYDQILLSKVVWPKILEIVLVHDSYFCHYLQRGSTPARPFPTKRDENFFFLGWGPLRPKSEIDELKKYKCRWQCRPLKHKDWLYC